MLQRSGASRMLTKWRKRKIRAKTKQIALHRAVIRAESQGVYHKAVNEAKHPQLCAITASAPLNVALLELDTQRALPVPCAVALRRAVTA